MDGYQLQLKVRQIIERSRRDDESFLPDTKTAAEEIDALYKAERLLEELEEVEIMQVA